MNILTSIGKKDKYLFHNDSQMAQISASYISEEYIIIKDHMSDFIQYRTYGIAKPKVEGVSMGVAC